MPDSTINPRRWSPGLATGPRSGPARWAATTRRPRGGRPAAAQPVGACHGWNHGSGHCSAAASRGNRVAPSMVSRMNSAWPPCRAVSSIRCSSTQRTDHSLTSAGNHGAPAERPRPGRDRRLRRSPRLCPGCGLVLVQRIRQRFLRGEPELGGVTRVRRPPRAALPLQDQIGPASLTPGGVLDQTTDAQLAGGGRLPGLIVRQAGQSGSGSPPPGRPSAPPPSPSSMHSPSWSKPRLTPPASSSCTAGRRSWSARSRRNSPTPTAPRRRDVPGRAADQRGGHRRGRQDDDRLPYSGRLITGMRDFTRVCAAGSPDPAAHHRAPRSLTARSDGRSYRVGTCALGRSTCS